jgi:adiponectin receptor
VVLTPKFSKPEYRRVRAGVFVSLGLFGVFPVGHAIWSKGFMRLTNEMGLTWLLLSALAYLSGAFI